LLNVCNTSFFFYHLNLLYFDVFVCLETFEAALQAGFQDGNDYVTLFLTYADLVLSTRRALSSSRGEKTSSDDELINSLRSLLQRAVDYLNQRSLSLECSSKLFSVVCVL
jgi:hypothetical protein